MFLKNKLFRKPNIFRHVNPEKAATNNVEILLLSKDNVFRPVNQEKAATDNVEILLKDKSSVVASSGIPSGTFHKF